MNEYPTFWSNTEKIENTLPIKYKYIKGDVPKTRYVILFNLRTETRRISFSKSLYDSKTDCMAECDELDQIYKHHSLPIQIKEEYTDKRTNKIQHHISYDYSHGKSWWGYIVLDFKLCQIIRIGGYGFYASRNFPLYKNISTHIIDKMKVANTPECRDFFFRDVDKVPDDYKFNDGEYEGWLQYKWGDGKNAIDYIAPKSTKKPKNLFEEFGYDYETHGLMEFPTPEDYDNEILENKFADLLDKETRKNLMDKFGR